MIKTPIPFMVCMVVAAGMSLKSGLGYHNISLLKGRMRRIRQLNPPFPPLPKGGKEDHAEAKVVPPFAKRGEEGFGEHFLLLSILPMIVLFSLPSKINIGIRYILPLIPLLCILAGKVATIRSKYWKGALVALCLWYAGSAFWTYPHYLAYFNELVGGPRNGYKYLVDSNLDWGQSLDELAQHLQENNITGARIKYFGPPGVMRYYGLTNSDLNDCEPSPGIHAVSATYLQNLYLDNPRCHDWLRKLEPKKVLGYSIFIYDVPAARSGRSSEF